MTSLGENNKEINIEVRSEILEYSLIVEGAINSLLLAYLGIMEKSNTKLFGQKTGISFKSKIDLLHDIDVLSKKEHADLELQMIVRNKFIHMLECNSFLSVLNQLDNGIKNKFKNHMDDPSEINNEGSCKESYRKIYNTNLNLILKKFELKRHSIEDKSNLITLLIQKQIRITDISFDFIDKLLVSLEETMLKKRGDNKIIELSNSIYLKCEKHRKSYSDDSEMIELDKKINHLLEQEKLHEYLK